MRIGIIIIFKGFGKTNFRNELSRYLRLANNVEFCLVSNCQNEYLSDCLFDISEQCENVSIVNIKKYKSDTAAIRAGARYMFNNFNPKHLGYISETSEQKLIELIDHTRLNLEEIVKIKIKEQNSRSVKQTLFQGIFSLSDLIKELHIKSLV